MGYHIIAKDINWPGSLPLGNTLGVGKISDRFGIMRIGKR